MQTSKWWIIERRSFIEAYTKKPMSTRKWYNLVFWEPDWSSVGTPWLLGLLTRTPPPSNAMCIKDGNGSLPNHSKVAPHGPWTSGCFPWSFVYDNRQNFKLLLGRGTCLKQDQFKSRPFARVCRYGSLEIVSSWALECLTKMRTKQVVRCHIIER